MEELIKAMSDEELERAKGLYKDNPKVMELLDGIIGGRVNEAEQAKIDAEFEAKLVDMANGKKKDGKPKLPHPEHVHNVMFLWAEVDIPDGEPEDIEVVDDDGSKSTESRQPTHKEYQWVVKVNHAVRVASGDTGTPTTSKRAIKVFKRDGTSLVDKGNYSSGAKACEALGITVGGDSAPRALAREGYIIEPYEGSDYTA